MSINPEFGGSTFDHKRDAADFRCQLDRTRGIMLGGGWHTLEYLASEVGCSEATVSARLRDLRKPRYGAYNIEKRVKVGTKRVYEYRMGFEHG
jgi:hypothetical protein